MSAGTGRIVADLLLRRGVCHRYGEHRSQCGDLYVPRGAGPFPVVVCVHGGSWTQKYGRIVMRAVAQDLVRRGFAAWNIEYRRVGGGGGWPMTFEDVGAAIDHLAALGDPRLRLDDVAALGHSAGGQLALWAVTRPKARIPIRRVVAQAAPARLTEGYGESIDALMGGSPAEHPDRYALADPARLLPLGVPALLVHGPDDATVSVRHSRRYAEAARAAGDDIELMEPASAPHRVHIDPRSEAWRLARDWLIAGRG